MERRQAACPGASRGRPASLSAPRLKSISGNESATIFPYRGAVPGKHIARYLNPWMFKREKKQQYFDILRKRDGDNCSRCRRPMRFELPRGHAQAPKIEHIKPETKGGALALDNLCLCHARCNWMMGDNTPEVQERMRLRA